jgi:hypothetical protein
MIKENGENKFIINNSYFGITDKTASVLASGLSSNNFHYLENLSLSHNNIT